MRVARGTVRILESVPASDIQPATFAMRTFSRDDASTANLSRWPSTRERFLIAGHPEPFSSHAKLRDRALNGTPRALCLSGFRLSGVVARGCARGRRARRVHWEPRRECRERAEDDVGASAGVLGGRFSSRIGFLFGVPFYSSDRVLNTGPSGRSPGSCARLRDRWEGCAHLRNGGVEVVRQRHEADVGRSEDRRAPLPRAHRPPARARPCPAPPPRRR